MSLPSGPPTVQSTTTTVPAPVASVRIAQVTARGFRCIGDLSVDLESTTTFLVGENNTGKTSLLSAISAALGRHRPNDDDLSRLADGTTSTKAEVDLIIRPGIGDTFGAFERGAFGANVHRITGESSEFVGIRSTFSKSREGGQLLVQRAFLQPGRQGLVVSPAEFHPSALNLFECELLDASRDLVADLGSKSSRWGRVLFDLQIPELPDADGVPHPLSRTTLEATLRSLAVDMRQASPVLTQLETDLARLAQVQNTVGDVSLLPFPPQIEEVMRSVEILLSHGATPALPLRFHGMGSRSLAALFVFSTLCSLRLGADKEMRPHFLTLVEEPESHLHPQAITALRAELDLLPGQRIVSTHSSHLVSEAPPRSIRVLRRTEGAFRVFRLSHETLADTARFRRFVERPFGAAERDALPVMLAAALGLPPSALGVTIVDCESLNHPQVPKLVAAAEELGLPWIVFVDNDAAGVAAIGNITDPDTGVAMTISSRRAVVAGARAIEQLLLDAGYGDEIVQVAAEQGDAVTTAGEQLQYLKKNKGWVGEAVASRALSNGKVVPAPVVKLAERIDELFGAGKGGGP
jgi:putative ATP-dependent endonuclease of the OLD family